MLKNAESRLRKTVSVSEVILEKISISIKVLFSHLLDS